MTSTLKNFFLAVLFLLPAQLALAQTTQLFVCMDRASDPLARQGPSAERAAIYKICASQLAAFGRSDFPASRKCPKEPQQQAACRQKWVDELVEIYLTYKDRWSERRPRRY